MAQTLERICEVPVQTIGIRGELVRDTGEPLDARDLVEFGPAIGLALAGLFDTEDVIRLAGTQTQEETVAHGRLEKILTRPLMCAGIAGAAFILAAGIHIGALRWETSKMNQAAARATASATIRNLQPQIVAKNRLERFRIDIEGICSDIAAAVKDPITLTSIQLSREHRIVIKGVAKDNPTAIFTLADDLRKSPRFKAVNPERASPGQGGDFVITAEVTGIEKLATPGLRGAL